jgi:hypothetical protein
MPGNLLFEYAVIRLVPRVEREEFLNLGVILYCRDRNFLEMLYTMDKERLRPFCDHLDLDELKQHLCAFENICLARPEGGPISKLDTGSRFRWLTAKRSTIVQTSEVHPGLCVDPKEMLEKLFGQLVL